MALHSFHHTVERPGTPVCISSVTGALSIPTMRHILNLRFSHSHESHFYLYSN